MKRKIYVSSDLVDARSRYLDCLIIDTDTDVEVQYKTVNDNLVKLDKGEDTLKECLTYIQEGTSEAESSKSLADAVKQELLVKKFKEDLGYSREDALLAQQCIPARGITPETVLAEIAKGKAIRDAWDPTTTSINAKWRNGGEAGCFFFPQLDFSNVTDAQKAFHSNSNIVFYPTQEFPACTDATGIYWYDGWFGDAAKYGDKSFPLLTKPGTLLGLCTIPNRFTLNIPAATNCSGLFQQSSLCAMPHVITGAAFSWQQAFYAADFYFDDDFFDVFDADLSNCTNFQWFLSTTGGHPVNITLQKFLDRIPTDKQGAYKSCFYSASYTSIKIISDSSVNIDLPKALDTSYMFRGASRYIPFDLGYCSVPTASTVECMFCKSGLRKIGDVTFSGATNAEEAFGENEQLQEIGDIDLTACTDFNWLFYDCKNLYKVGTIKVPASNNCGWLFGDADVTETNRLTYFGGFEDLGLGFTGTCEEGERTLDLSYSPKLTHDSLMNVINKLGTAPTGLTVPAILKLGEANYKKLTADEIAIAVAKNWEVVQ